MDTELFLKTIKYYKKLILTSVIITALSVLIGSIIWLELSPLYEGHAEIIIFPTNMELNLGKELSPLLNATPTTSITQTYSDVSLSRAFAEKTIRRLWDKDFASPQKLSLVRAAYEYFLKPVVNKGVKLYYFLSYGKFVEAEPFENLVNKLIERTSISPEPGSYIINIDLTWDDPQIAADAANIIAGLYIAQSLEDNRKAALQVREFIEQKIEETKAQLQNSKNAILDYKSQETIISLPQQEATLIQNLADYKTQLFNTEIQIATLEAKREKLQQELNNMEAQIVTSKLIISNPVIQELESRLASKEIKLASLKAEYKDGAPEPKVISDIKREIDNTKKEIATQVKQISEQESVEFNPVHQDISKQIVFLTAQIISLNAQAKQIKATLGAYQDIGKVLPYQEKELSELLRENSNIEASLVLLNQKYQEARIAEISKLSSIRVKDTAIPAVYPKHPKVLLNMLASFPLGGFIALFCILLNEFRNTKVRNEEDIRQITTLPVIGVLADSGGSQRMLCDNTATEHTGKTYLPKHYQPLPIDVYLQPFSRIIRNSRNGSTPRSYLFTSVTPDVPKSKIIASLANNISDRANKVLIIDANFYYPQMRDIFNIKDKDMPGLRDILKKRLPFYQAVYNLKPNLDIILCAGTQSKNNGSNNNLNIDFDHLSTVICDAAREYSHIFIDATPLSCGLGTDLMQQYVDKLILVVNSGGLSKNQFSSALDRLKTDKNNLLGIVINMPPA
jgi:succinoglycan biosynthesis transport protein ExoP